MTKLVVLKLDVDGDLSTGVRVTLEIGSQGDRASIEMTGSLPPSLNLTQVYDKWKDSYCSLGRSTRIIPESIIIDGDITSQQCLENAEVLRSSLNEWLRSPGFAPLREKYLQQLQPDEEVQVLIRTNNEALQKLPWQLWELIEKYPEAGVALSPAEYERPSDNNRPLGRNQVKNKIKILAILGHSKGIKVDEDRKILEKLDYANTTFLVEPQLEQISDQLWEQSWDILFFAGHSQSEGETGRIYINKTDSLTIEELKHGLEKTMRNGLQLAIFNSCDGLGLARALQRLQIPQMIFMREPVPDEIAQKYLKYLLQAFINEDKKLYVAEREARERLKDLENTYPCASWLPILLQHPAVIPPTRDQLCGLSGERNGTGWDKGTELPKRERRARKNLLVRMKDEVNRRLEQLLPNALSIRLHKEKQPQQVVPYWDTDVNTREWQTTPLSPNTEIIKVFDKEEIAGKLLILGTPGSGKTIALLELGRELIARAESDPDEPMPVLLNLSSWKNDKQTIAEWLVAELKSNRRIPQNIGKKWLENRQLLLLLDGLDELKERQLLCIEAINRFEQDYRLQPLVVCTRLDEYELCRIKLQLNEAICLKALSSEQIQQYLELVGHSQLWQSIEDDPSLRELAKSPLLLRMMTLASQEILSWELQGFNSAEEPHWHLFDGFIRSMLTRNHRQICYASGKEPTPQQTRRWLSYLAKMLELEAQTEFLIENMQPHWLQNRHEKRLYRMGVGLITGLILGFSITLVVQLSEVLHVGLSGDLIGVAFWGLISVPFLAVTHTLTMGLLYAMIGWLWRGWTYSLIGGSILGAIFLRWQPREGVLWLPLGLIGVICAGLAGKVRTVETFKWSWQRAKRGIVYGLIGSGFIGMMAGFFYRFDTNIDFNSVLRRLFVGLIVSLVLALLFGLPLGAMLGGIRSPNLDIEARIIPNQGILQSLANTRIYALIGVSTGWLNLVSERVSIHSYTSNMSSTDILHSVSMSDYSLLLGSSLMCGLIALMIPGFACIQHLSLRTVLYWRGLIPWNYARFLNYATEKRLIQKIGGRYRFIHALLQEHFAQM